MPVTTATSTERRNLKLELTWVGKYSRPLLEPRILLHEPERSHHGPFLC